MPVSDDLAPYAAEPLPVSPGVAQVWLRSDDAVLIDVREPFENAANHIGGSMLRPLGSIDAQDIAREFGGSRVIFHCQAGKRSQEAAERCAAAGVMAFTLDGGIDAWKSAGLPVERSASAPRIGVMRQVQITAGSLVLLGVVLGATVAPAFLGISAVVGCGLVFAGATGWCGLAKALSLAPWNRVHGTSCSS
ncbi:MAG: hypothetical protein CMJ31_05445 [Phycisphaerae bacterium]|nr:hypothetical protein [Phycisphaerae bacterium]